MAWVKRWQVPSKSVADKFYTVALDENGKYGCDCPAWKFKKERVDCKHIKDADRGLLGCGEDGVSDTDMTAEAARGRAMTRRAGKRAECVTEMSGLEALRANAKWGVV